MNGQKSRRRPSISPFSDLTRQAISVIENQKDPERRRRVPRELIKWPAAFRIDGEDVWSECEVVDISVVGVGIETTAKPASDLLDHKIFVEVHTPAGASVTLSLTATVRYLVPRPNGKFRLGGEFAGLSEVERSILETLERMQIAW